ncbi:FAD-dependent oxidoreductase [Pelagibius sp. 7325]|uniref:NAD(P)/FAD-dependent oxidoreductase n=1 Tax=Pelagibius sp. 7325 TaxID=3131994 RepID=UPI0030EB565A
MTGGNPTTLYDVVVVGGGLHGLSAALHLARGGARVGLLERAWIGRHASGASAAGVRTLGRPIAELPISLEAMAMWHDIRGLVDDDCGFHMHGQIKVAENASELAGLRQRDEQLRALGYRHEEIVDAQELRRLLPPIAPHCVGAAVARDNGAADPHRTLQAFRRSAEAAGVAIYEGCGVERVESVAERWRLCGSRATVEAPVVVNAAGAWAGRLAALFGDGVPLGTKASMMIVTERVAPYIAPVVSCAGRALSFKQTDRGTLLIGGGVQGRFDLQAEKTTVDFVALRRAAQAAIALFPSVVGVAMTRVWAGLEAKTEDLLPVIGPSPSAPGLLHAFGFSGHGFQLVPVVGAIIAELAASGSTTRQIAPFALERLTVKEAAA